MKTDLLVMKATTFGRCVRDNGFDWTSGLLLGDYCSIENVGERETCSSIWDQVTLTQDRRICKWISATTYLSAGQYYRAMSIFDKIAFRNLNTQWCLYLGGNRRTRWFSYPFLCISVEAESCKSSNIMMMMNKWHGRSKRH